MLLYTLSNFEGDFERKIKQFWAWVEKSIAYKKYLVYAGSDSKMEVPGCAHDPSLDYQNLQMPV